MAALLFATWRNAELTRAIGLSIALLWAGAITIGIYDVVSDLLKRSSA